MNEKRFFKFSAFDIGVAIVALLLILLVLGLSTFMRPTQRGAMVAYLYPARGDSPNLWLMPLDEPAQARQLTFSVMGVDDFNVSPDGRQIAYTMRDEEKRIHDIYMLDLQTGNSQRLSFCADEGSECYGPIFHPNGSVLAYIRTTEEEPAEEHDFHVPRIWLMDLSSNTPRALATDSQLLGHSPEWSLDGNTIAFFSADATNPGIMVYNFNPQSNENPSLHFIPASNGAVGSLSPNGQMLIFPDITYRNEQFFSYLKIADFSQTPPVYQNLTDPNDAIDDVEVQWHPDGRRASFVRRYTDERWTQGYQLYEIDVQTGEIIPLLLDEHYTHHAISWDLNGENLLMQRLQLMANDGSINNLAQPEIWILNIETGSLTKIVEGAYLPRWVQAR